MAPHFQPISTNCEGDFGRAFLLRLSRTGFEATEFPRRHDGPSNTLSIIRDTIVARRFALKEDKKAEAIRCDSKCG
jgi:hypothetical protein